MPTSKYGFMSPQEEVEHWTEIKNELGGGRYRLAQNALMPMADVFTSKIFEMLQELEDCQRQTGIGPTLRRWLTGEGRPFTAIFPASGKPVMIWRLKGSPNEVRLEARLDAFGNVKHYRFRVRVYEVTAFNSDCLRYELYTLLWSKWNIRTNNDGTFPPPAEVARRKNAA